MKTHARFLAAAITATLAACATTPDTLPEIEQARARVESLAQNPLATGTANRDLTAARSALAQAEQALEEREDREVVTHLAYLANRRAELGLARIEEAEARERISRAEAQRNEVLIDARSREARAAEQQALAARQDAQTSQQSALQARAELESMQKDFAALQAKQTDRGMVLTLGDVLFDTDRATLKPGVATTIDRLAEFLGRNGDMRIRIEGHTDSTGADEYNMELSRRRAQAVADALSAQAVPLNRVHVQGRGEAYPVASNDTSAGRQQNRRVEIVFSDQAGGFAGTTAPPPPSGR